MSKKMAHVVLIFIDILALIALWLCYNEIHRVVIGISNSVDAISFNNRIGFLFVAAIMPVVHIFAVCHHYWLQKAFEKKTNLINWSFIALGIAIFASAFFISARMKTYVERAGYRHCTKADDKMTFSTYLVYTKDTAICSQLVIE
jgi:hypothetical protein